MYSVLFNSLSIHCICDSTVRTDKRPGARCLAQKKMHMMRKLGADHVFCIIQLVAYTLYMRFYSTHRKDAWRAMPGMGNGRGA